MKNILPFLILLFACSAPQEEGHATNRKAEYIYRLKKDVTYQLAVPKQQARLCYPWEESFIGVHHKITKEFFRCRGNILNPPIEGTERIADCGGIEKHSLYLRDGKEFIYPILLDLLNDVQAKTGKRVVITSGYRCPDHNRYIDSSPSNATSKHMIGAEVDFYVQGLEQRPESVINLLMNYYKDQEEFSKFERWEKGDTGTVTPPWYNKEVFIKLYKPSEGRNFDNRHNYPYIAIQVRYDRVRKEKVVYDWQNAFHNYLRK